MSNSKNNKWTVFFDSGGILIDESEIEEFSAQVLIEIIKDRNPAYSQEFYTSDVRVAIMVHCPSIPEYVIWQNCNKDRELFGDLLDRYRVRFQEERPKLKLNEPIKPILEEISGEFDLGIAGQYGSEIVELLEEHNILNHFTHTYTQDDFDTTKPDTRFYSDLLGKCRCEPSRSIMVGDRIDKDVIPAQTIGMKTILVRTGIHRIQQPRTPSEFPDRELKSLDDLGIAIREVSGKIT